MEGLIDFWIERHYNRGKDEGKTDRVISRELGISERTLEGRRSSLIHSSKLKKNHILSHLLLVGIKMIPTLDVRQLRGAILTREDNSNDIVIVNTIKEQLEMSE